MDNAIELLLKQLEKTNESIRDCQNKLTFSLVVVCVAIVLIIFIFFRGKGRVKINNDEIIIGDVKDKEELHKLVLELRKENKFITETLKELQKKNKL